MEELVCLGHWQFMLQCVNYGLLNIQLALPTMYDSVSGVHSLKCAMRISPAAQQNEWRKNEIK